MNGIVLGFALESSRAVPLVIDGCATLDRSRLIGIRTQAWVQPDLVRQRANAEYKTRMRPRYLIGYHRAADIVA